MSAHTSIRPSVFTIEQATTALTSDDLSPTVAAAEIVRDLVAELGILTTAASNGLPSTAERAIYAMERRLGLAAEILGKMVDEEQARRR